MKERRKRIIAVLIAAVMMVTFALAGITGAKADSVSKTIKLKIGSKTVYINGQPEQMDVAPFIDPHSNRTLVPIRFVAEGLGGKVSWHPHERFVGVLVGTNKVGLWIGKKTAKIARGTGFWDRFDKYLTKVTDQAPEIVPPGRTMIPLRFVSESVGAKVVWNGQTREITITLSYTPAQVGDVLFAIPFDQDATSASSGYCISPGSAMAVDPDHNSFFVYGEKRIIDKNEPPKYQATRDRHHEYLFKYDSLTGIKIGSKIIFNEVDPGWYGGQNGFAIVDWLAYHDGYLYCATPNNGFYDLPFFKMSIYIKKVDPVHMSVIWAKSYNLRNTLYQDISYKGNPDRTTYLEIMDKNRVPLVFTPNGKMTMIFSTYVMGISDKDKNRSYNLNFADYYFVNLLNFDTKTGNLVWKARHDGWSYYCEDPNRMPVYKGRYLYMFENILSVPTSCYATPKSDSDYNYQSIYLTKLTQKLIQETHAKSNMKPPYCGQFEGYYSPERIVCVDLYTGKSVWTKYFIDNKYEGYINESPPLSLVNGILYIPETTYDPGVSFSTDPRDQNFGTEMLRFDTLTGNELPIPHKPYGRSVQNSYVSTIISVNGQPKDVDAVAGSYIYKNGYLFVSIQSGGQMYDPNYPDKLVGWETYFYFAPVSNLLLKDPTDAGLGISTETKTLYKYLKPYTFKYFTPSRTPVVPTHDETPGSGMSDVYMRYANGNIYAFYKKIGNTKPKYPSIVCINATP